MKGMQYFYELFELLPRGGPGSAEDTHKAFNLIPNPPKNPLILDIGCGSGPQTLELAKITNGKIIAIDNHQGFLDKLIQRIKNEGLEKKITVKTCQWRKWILPTKHSTSSGRKARYTLWDSKTA